MQPLDSDTEWVRNEKTQEVTEVTLRIQVSSSDSHLLRESSSAEALGPTLPRGVVRVFMRGAQGAGSTATRGAPPPLREVPPHPYERCPPPLREVPPHPYERCPPTPTRGAPPPLREVPPPPLREVPPHPYERCPPHPYERCPPTPTRGGGAQSALFSSGRLRCDIPVTGADVLMFVGYGGMEI
ncbi:unnamed protein product [Boreogadus saida]